jgi:transcription initiation factor IIE alpha subunit
MDEYSLPPDVQRLINEVLESMDHVEVLFRLGREGEVTFERLSKEVHVAPAQLQKALRDLEDAKLITSDGATYRVTQSARDREAVESFVTTYNTRPVTLIRAVYARPSPLRTFADAFRLRREEDR